MVTTRTDAYTGAVIPTSPPTVAVDRTRRQIELQVPHDAWDPGCQTVHLAAAVGLWDPGHDRYLLAQQTSSATSPGGAGAAAEQSAFFNVTFRFAMRHQHVPDRAGGARHVGEHHGVGVQLGQPRDQHLDAGSPPPCPKRRSRRPGAQS